MISETVSLMMLISAFISLMMLIGVLAFSKKTYFEDIDKSFEYPLFDTDEDLQNAIELEKKQKQKKKDD